MKCFQSDFFLAKSSLSLHLGLRCKQVEVEVWLKVELRAEKMRTITTIIVIIVIIINIIITIIAIIINIIIIIVIIINIIIIIAIIAIIKSGVACRKEAPHYQSKARIWEP